MKKIIKKNFAVKYEKILKFKLSKHKTNFFGLRQKRGIMPGTDKKCYIKLNIIT